MPPDPSPTLTRRLAPIAMHRRWAMRVAMGLGTALLIAGCAPLPQTGAAPASRTTLATEVQLIPVEPILAEADSLGTAQAAIAPVDARLARLRARAAALRRQ